MRLPGEGAWDAQSRVIHDCVTGRRTVVREWYPMDAEALAVIADRERVSRNAELERQRRMEEAFTIELKKDEQWLDRNPLRSWAANRDGSTTQHTHRMNETVREQIENNVLFSIRGPRRYSDPSEDLEQPLYYGTGAIPLTDFDWTGIRASRLAQQAEAELSFNIALTGATVGVPGPEDIFLGSAVFAAIWSLRFGRLADNVIVPSVKTAPLVVGLTI